MSRLQKIFIRKKRKKESYFKYIIALFHLWLGLLSSIIVFIVCLTGSIYAFKNQVLDFFTETITIQETRIEDFVLENYISIFTANFEKPTSIWIKKNSIEITSFSKNNIGTYAYFNSKSGKLIGVRNRKIEFFFEFILKIHRFLLVEKPGKLIVGISILVFTYLLISGFILWFPNTKGKTKKAFSLKLNSKFKRLNYDLHRILGFYSFILLLLMAITGLYVSFHWFKNLNIQALGGPSISINQSNIGNNGLSKDISNAFNKLFDDILQTAENKKEEKSIDKLLRITKQQTINNHTVKINLPFLESNYYSFNFYKEGILSSSIYDEIKINKYGKINEIKTFNNLKLYQKYIHIVKPLHTGEIFGITTIILYFIISLIGCSLPITGFIIWFNKAQKLV